MADYINRKAALDAVDVGNLHRGIIDALQAIISDIPAADVRPVARGVWVSVHDRYGICSNCHRGDHIDPLAGFCRFCGADMRKKKNEKKPNPNFVPPPTVGAKNARTGFAARWIPFWNSFLNEEEFRCSECDAKYQHTYDTCPWCGATMKGE